MDALYMQATLSLSGSGGWPMTVFLTPDGRPFYAGTYFPKTARGGLPGVRRPLPRDRGRLPRPARGRRGPGGRGRAPARRGRRRAPPRRGRLDAAHPRRRGRRAWPGSSTRSEGGFGGAPKFPPSLALEFLLRRLWRRPDDHHAREMVELTLGKMAAGGIYDQVGGGFHRYSVDGRWLVPHFEKMLYDNALLARAYALAYRVTGSPAHRRVAEETLDYLLREMRVPRGGFGAAQDADSPGGEGAFFVWTPGRAGEPAPAGAGPRRDPPLRGHPGGQLRGRARSSTSSRRSTPCRASSARTPRRCSSRRARRSTPRARRAPRAGARRQGGDRVERPGDRGARRRRRDPGPRRLHRRRRSRRRRLRARRAGGRRPAAPRAAPAGAPPTWASSTTTPTSATACCASTSATFQPRWLRRGAGARGPDGRAVRRPGRRRLLLRRLRRRGAGRPHPRARGPPDPRRQLPGRPRAAAPGRPHRRRRPRGAGGRRAAAGAGRHGPLPAGVRHRPDRPRPPPRRAARDRDRRPARRPAHGRRSSAAAREGAGPFDAIAAGDPADPAAAAAAPLLADRPLVGGAPAAYVCRGLRLPGAGDRPRRPRAAADRRRDAACGAT